MSWLGKLIKTIVKKPKMKYNITLIDKRGNTVLKTEESFDIVPIVLKHKHLYYVLPFGELTSEYRKKIASERLDYTYKETDIHWLNHG